MQTVKRDIDKQMELLKIWKILIRRRWVILAAYLIFISAVLAFTLIVTPSYKATTTILVKSSSATNSLLTSLGLQASAFVLPTEYDTDISLALSKSLARKVIDELQIKDRFGRDMREDKFVKSSILNFLWPQPAVKVEQYEDSTILEVSAFSADPKEAAEIANLLAMYFVEKRKELVSNEYQESRLFVEQQIGALRQNYYASLEKLSNFMIVEGSIDLDLEATNLINKIRDIIVSRDANNNALVLYEQELQESERYLGEIGKYRKEYREFIKNPRINELKSSLNSTLVTLAGKKIDFLPTHPEYRQTTTEMKKLEELIRKELAHDLTFNKEQVAINPLHDDLYKKYIDIKINLALAHIKKELFNKLIDTYQEELLTFPLKKTKQSKLALELEVTSNLYNNLLAYLNESEIAQSIQFGNYRICESAKPPQKVLFPNKKLNLVLGIILGCLWALVIGFLIEYTDDTLRSHEDINQFDSIHLLGRVYKYFGYRANLLLNPSLPRSPLVETYRSIKNNIYMAGNGSPPETIVVTSSIKGEGKSTVAANLGMVYAMAGKHTLLVDIDLHSPGLHTLFAGPAKKGFAGLLTGSKIEDCLTKSGFNHLEVLPCGPVPDDPGAVIETCRLDDILADLHLTYDLVIFDSPPLNTIAGALLLNKKIAADFILVAEPGKVTYKVLADSLSLFKKSGRNRVGVVVNKVRSVEGGTGADSFEGFFEKCLRGPGRFLKKIFY